MSVSSAFLDFACELLGGLGPVRSRRMFGGAGLYAADVMFALVADDTIYLKADDALAEALEAEGSGPFIYDGGKSGKPMAMRYWRMPEAALDEPELATEWARRALDVALTARR
ncbi:MAG: TfoX/Sxy family protein [Pseudomonadota bacterium]